MGEGGTSKRFEPGTAHHRVTLRNGTEEESWNEMSHTRGKAPRKKNTIPPSSSHSLTSLSLECLQLRPKKGGPGEAYHLTVTFRPTKMTGRETNQV